MLTPVRKLKIKTKSWSYLLIFSIYIIPSRCRTTKYAFAKLILWTSTKKVAHKHESDPKSQTLLLLLGPQFVINWKTVNCRFCLCQGRIWSFSSQTGLPGASIIQRKAALVLFMKFRFIFRSICDNQDSAEELCQHYMLLPACIKAVTAGWLRGKLLWSVICQTLLTSTQGSGAFLCLKEAALCRQTRNSAERR